jgi:hypothetical protein
MSNDAYDELDKLKQLAKDQREYKVFEYISAELNKFVQTMPIIRDI